MKKVSIVIPVYNVRCYLPQCLDSILAQNYENWEAILVDDGATDDSGAICDRYACADSRFQVIHKENGGAASAKNAGLDAISGDYVAFIDSDDYVEPYWLEKLVSTAQNQHADVVEFDFDKVWRTHAEPENNFPEPLRIFTAQSYLEQYLENWTCSLFWNKLIRRELVGQIRFRKERRCIDDEFFTYKVVSGAVRIVRISDVLYHYRQRSSSAVFNEKNRRQIADDALEVLVERYEWVCGRFPQLRRTYLRHDVQILFFFAGFSHTDRTVQKFRRIARYYLLQTLRHHPGLDLLWLALKLQRISEKVLLAPEKRPEETGNPDCYFI